MKKLIVIVLFIISFAITAQEAPANGAIFPYDTCAPPCWLGLIPEVSTSQDVESVLEQHSDIVDPESIDKVIYLSSDGQLAINEETGEIQSGDYFFDILTPITQFLLRTSSRIEIEDGVVDLMVILTAKEYDIFMSDVLKQMGTPDQIHMEYSETDSIDFYFIYLDHLMRVNFSLSAEQCFTSNVTERFTLWNALYYSKHSAYKLVRGADYRDILQPALTRFGLKNERDVPPDLWEQWISGEIAESCFEAWEKLEPPDLEAIAITPTPTIEITAEATP